MAELAHAFCGAANEGSWDYLPSRMGHAMQLMQNIRFRSFAHDSQGRCCLCGCGVGFPYRDGCNSTCLRTWQTPTHPVCIHHPMKYSFLKGIVNSKRSSWCQRLQQLRLLVAFKRLFWDSRCTHTHTHTRTPMCHVVLERAFLQNQLSGKR